MADAITKHVAWGRDGLMVIAAHRYCMGRMTYIVSDCADWLVSIWHELPESVRKIIQRDTEEAFARDDEDRTEGRNYKTLGHDCDRKAWERVRGLWSHAAAATAPVAPGAGGGGR